MKNKILLPLLLLAGMTVVACNPSKGSSEAPTDSSQISEVSSQEDNSSSEQGTSSQTTPSSSQQQGSSSQSSSSSDTTVYGVTIDNKTQLAEEWFKGSQRTLSLTLSPAANAMQEMAKKNLTVTSSDPTTVSITGLGLNGLKPGSATITVKYHNATDTVTVTISDNSPKARYGTSHEGTEEDPFTNEDALKVANSLGKDEATAEKYYVKGTVESFREAPSDYGNVSFYFAPAQAGGAKFLVYRVMKGEKGEKITADDIWIGGEVTVYVNMKNYNGNTPENSAGWFVKCEGEKPQIQNHEVNVAEAIAACAALGDNNTSDGKDTYDVTGYIVAVNGADFYMSDTKGAASINSATQFQVYNYTGANKAKCTVNAKVKVSCTLKYYVSTSTAGKFAYETSVINSVTILEEGDEPDIEITGATALETVTAGTYKVGFLQKTINKNCFFKGTVNSSKYGETSPNWADAADVVVEGDATAGFKMKVGDKYLNPVLDGTKVRVGLETTGVTYAWNAIAHSFTTEFTADGKTNTYMFGTYSTYDTISLSTINNVIADGKVKAGQFPLQFYAPAEMNADPTAIQFVGKEASALVGVPLALEYRANPYNVDASKFTWESSDPTVATVAGGVVTGLKEGETTITAKFGTEIADTIKVNVAGVNLGTLENPLTVSEALAAAETLGLSGSQLTPKKVYVKGVIETRNDTFVNGDYFGKYNIKDASKKLYIVNSKPISTLQGKLFDNDEVIMSGFMGVDATNGTQLIKDGNNDYPVVESLAQRGVSSITVEENAHAQVTDLSATSAANLSTFTFKVTTDASYSIGSVKINGEVVEPDADGVYTGTVKGNTVIVITVNKELTPNGDPVTISKTMTEIFGDTSATPDGEPMRNNQLDTVASFTVNETGNSGKVYSSGTTRQWRLYQGDKPVVKINVIEGYAIQSVTFTYSPNNGGTITYNGENVASGTAIAINPILASVEFGVGNSGTATNGQARVTAISVTYVPAV